MSDILPGFSSIRDQSQPIWLLKTLLQKGTLPHALLFTGLEGVGKRMAAELFAMACLCRNSQRNKNEISSHSPSHSLSFYPDRPCTQCAACRRVVSGNHPDVIRINPDGAFIRIGQIRSLCTTLSMKPYGNGYRVVLIGNAHLMNKEAGNALLKVLEEPPAGTILILTATGASELLPTIVSRCQRIQFNPLTPESITAELVERNGISPTLARSIAALANGSMSKAFDMLKNNFLNHRKWLLTATGMQQSAGGKIPIWQGLAVAEKLFKLKESINDSLEIIKFWLRDILIYPYSPDKIVNQDMGQEIARLSQSEPHGLLLKKLDAVESAQKAIEANANLRLTLEVMVMRLTRTNDGP